MTRTTLMSLIVATAFGLTGCDNSRSPAAPTPVPTPTALAVLSGVISEATSAGTAPLEGVTVTVYLDTRPTTTTANALTDSNGQYSIAGIRNGAAYVWLSKDGYAEPSVPTPPCDGGCHTVMVDGDTRFDAELVRQ